MRSILSSITKTSMSNLVPGQILHGAKWNYRVSHILKGDGTHISVVAKSIVLPHNKLDNHPEWAVIKLAGTRDSKEDLVREVKAYTLPGVNSAQCIRQQFPVDGQDIIALEWVDLTLANIIYQPNPHLFALIRAVLHAALSSCIILADQKYVNTGKNALFHSSRAGFADMKLDFKPANILLSGVGTQRVVAKVGDLGSVYEADRFINCQPLAMRAPEVFLRHRCAEPAQVWAIAAMLLVWMKPGFLGVRGKPQSSSAEAWCIVKLKRLFPDWKIPLPSIITNEVLKSTITAALRMYQAPAPEERVLHDILPLDKEMDKVPMPQELKSLLRIMLVPDPRQRPSAAAVLESLEYQAFEKLTND